MSEQKFRLITRSDFDGLVCAVLLYELDLIDEIKFAHPKDMQDGKVEVSARDITTNLPYVPGVHLSFDHHLSETVRVAGGRPNHIIGAEAPSAARVVYEYYGGKRTFPRISGELMDAVDKSDSAQFSREEIKHPTGWVLLNFVTDPRTGLGRFREFRISNYAMMMELTRHCREQSIEQILALPDVQERVNLYWEHASKAKEQISRCARLEGNLVVLDMRNEETIWPTNRFMVYAMYPQVNISLHIMWGLGKEITVFAVGKSIINRSSRTNIGELMLKYGGGGHQNAGTCQIDNAQAERVLGELLAKINADG